VGFGLAPTARGTGQGFQVLPLLVGWVAQPGEVRRVMARTLGEKEPCEAMLAQAGFTDVNGGAVIHDSGTPAPCAERR